MYVSPICYHTTIINIRPDLSYHIVNSYLSTLSSHMHSMDMLWNVIEKLIATTWSSKSVLKPPRLLFPMLVLLITAPPSVAMWQSVVNPITIKTPYSKNVSDYQKLSVISFFLLQPCNFSYCSINQFPWFEALYNAISGCALLHHFPCENWQTLSTKVNQLYPENALLLDFAKKLNYKSHPTKRSFTVLHSIYTKSIKEVISPFLNHLKSKTHFATRTHAR